ncbi:hypothetical protein DSM104299_03710 [Baekduia alba]|uniref:four-carbon acid sugar kinase family protein n=1 Tax=Baekduia alba TaxID=2997333 RepID=UPI002341048A|nr:four-carbon acid sugar kinase family protein [Baekduia alba]WCB94970.1 hypothetical protein DSM104299_03710 [Baekduia alba]
MADGALAARLREQGTRIAVIDDDPTGTQTVRDIPVITSWDAAEIAWALGAADPLFAILTNTRALSERRAAQINRVIGARLAAAARALDVPVRVISRGDSTLRGHFPAEPQALADGLNREGAPVDLVVVCPAYPAAGRVTVNGLHLLRDGGGALTPIAETEFAADPAFAFRSSRLADWVLERAGAEATVGAIGLDELRATDPGIVARRLRALASSVRYVVVDAARDEDLAVLAAAVQEVEDDGLRVLCRTGPAFVSARAGRAAAPPLTAGEVGAVDGPGLVVAGSFTALTTRQLDAARAARPALATVELDVAALLADAGGHRAEILIDRTAVRLAAALDAGDAVLATTRRPLHAHAGEASLASTERVADAVVAVVRAVAERVDLAWLVAKGGITSHDVAVRGLGVRRARVLGQLFAGQVSVWDPGPDSLRPGLRYVVFPGNVGDDLALARTIDRLKGEG